MTPQKPTTHTLIDRKLIVYLRERSAVWQCRFNVDGRWQTASTGERGLAEPVGREFESRPTHQENTGECKIAPPSLMLELPSIS